MDEEKKTKNEAIEDFVKYCKDNPNERFWDALRNWSEQDFILFGNLSNRLGVKDFATIDGVKVYVKDTSEYTGKNS